MDDKAYLSIIEWPPGVDEAEAAGLLARAAEMDVHQATLAVRRGVPQVIARLDALTAELAVERLRDAKVVAFAPRQSVMRSFIPRRIKRLIPALGSHPPMYACEMWREETVPLKTEQILLFVYASLRSSETRSTSQVGGARAGGMAAGFMLGGVPGAVVGGALAGGPTRHTSTRVTVSEMLDIYLRDGSCLRIDADRFNFDVLGPARGVADRENITKLLRRLTAEAPRAILDQSFREFRCPPEFVRTHFVGGGNSGTKRTSDAPGFDFYSSWVWLMYRSLMGQA